MKAAGFLAILAIALSAPLGFAAPTIAKEESSISSVAGSYGSPSHSRPSIQDIYSSAPTTIEGNNKPALDKLLPRVPPFILPGPNPTRLNVAITLWTISSRSIIHKLLTQAFADTNELCMRNPEGVVPEGGFQREFRGFAFSVIPREGVQLTWYMVRFTILRTFTFMVANHYGLARIDLQNGARVVAVGMIDQL